MAEAVQTNNNDNKTENNHKEIFPDEVITKLTTGFTGIFKPPLEQTKHNLGELLEKQEVLLEQLHDENLKVSWTQNSVELQKMFDIISTYHNKLVNIKKDMRMLHDKNIKLKKRALRLRQHKEKLDHLQNQQKEIDLKREQELIGKSSSKPS